MKLEQGCCAGTDYSLTYYSSIMSQGSSNRDSNGDRPPVAPKVSTPPTEASRGVGRPTPRAKNAAASLSSSSRDSSRGDRSSGSGEASTSTGTGGFWSLHESAKSLAHFASSSNKESRAPVARNDSNSTDQAVDSRGLPEKSVAASRAPEPSVPGTVKDSNSSRLPAEAPSVSQAPVLDQRFDAHLSSKGETNSSALHSEHMDLASTTKHPDASTIEVPDPVASEPSGMEYSDSAGDAGQFEEIQKSSLHTISSGTENSDASESISSTNVVRPPENVESSDFEASNSSTSQAVVTSTEGTGGSAPNEISSSNVPPSLGGIFSFPTTDSSVPVGDVSKAARISECPTLNTFDSRGESSSSGTSSHPALQGGRAEPTAAAGPGVPEQFGDPTLETAGSVFEPKKHHQRAKSVSYIESGVDHRQRTRSISSITGTIPTGHNEAFPELSPGAESAPTVVQMDVRNESESSLVGIGALNPPVAVVAAPPLVIPDNVSLGSIPSMFESSTIASVDMRSQQQPPLPTGNQWQILQARQQQPSPLQEDLQPNLPEQPPGTLTREGSVSSQQQNPQRADSSEIPGVVTLPAVGVQQEIQSSSDKGSPNETKELSFQQPDLSESMHTQQTAPAGSLRAISTGNLQAGTAAAKRTRGRFNLMPQRPANRIPGSSGGSAPPALHSQPHQPTSTTENASTSAANARSGTPPLQSQPPPTSGAGLSPIAADGNSSSSLPIPSSSSSPAISLSGVSMPATQTSEGTSAPTVTGNVQSQLPQTSSAGLKNGNSFSSLPIPSSFPAPGQSVSPGVSLSGVSMPATQTFDGTSAPNFTVKGRFVVTKLVDPAMIPQSTNTPQMTQQTNGAEESGPPQQQQQQQTSQQDRPQQERPERQLEHHQEQESPSNSQVPGNHGQRQNQTFQPQSHQQRQQLEHKDDEHQEQHQKRPEQYQQHLDHGQVPNQELPQQSYQPQQHELQQDEMQRHQDHSQQPQRSQIQIQQEQQQWSGQQQHQHLGHGQISDQNLSQQSYQQRQAQRQQHEHHQVESQQHQLRHSQIQTMKQQNGQHHQHQQAEPEQQQHMDHGQVSHQDMQMTSYQQHHVQNHERQHDEPQQQNQQLGHSQNQLQQQRWTEQQQPEHQQDERQEQIHLQQQQQQQRQQQWLEQQHQQRQDHGQNVPPPSYQHQQDFQQQEHSPTHLQLQQQPRSEQQQQRQDHRQISHQNAPPQSYQQQQESQQLQHSPSHLHQQQQHRQDHGQIAHQHTPPHSFQQQQDNQQLKHSPSRLQPQQQQQQQQRPEQHKQQRQDHGQMSNQKVPPQLHQQQQDNQQLQDSPAHLQQHQQHHQDHGQILHHDAQLYQQQQDNQQHQDSPAHLQQQQQQQHQDHGQVLHRDAQLYQQQQDNQQLQQRQQQNQPHDQMSNQNEPLQSYQQHSQSHIQQQQLSEQQQQKRQDHGQMSNQNVSPQLYLQSQHQHQPEQQQVEHQEHGQELRHSQIQQQQELQLKHQQQQQWLEAQQHRQQQDLEQEHQQQQQQLEQHHHLQQQQQRSPPLHLDQLQQEQDYNHQHEHQETRPPSKQQQKYHEHQVQQHQLNHHQQQAHQQARQQQQQPGVDHHGHPEQENQQQQQHVRQQQATHYQQPQRVVGQEEEEDQARQQPQQHHLDDPRFDHDARQEGRPQHVQLQEQPDYYQHHHVNEHEANMQQQVQAQQQQLDHHQRQAQDELQEESRQQLQRQQEQHQIIHHRHQEQQQHQERHAHDVRSQQQSQQEQQRAHEAVPPPREDQQQPHVDHHQHGQHEQRLQHQQQQQRLQLQPSQEEKPLALQQQQFVAQYDDSISEMQINVEIHPSATTQPPDHENSLATAPPAIIAYSVHGPADIQQLYQEQQFQDQPEPQQLVAEVAPPNLHPPELVIGRTGPYFSEPAIPSTGLQAAARSDTPDSSVTGMDSPRSIKPVLPSPQLTRGPIANPMDRSKTNFVAKRKIPLPRPNTNSRTPQTFDSKGGWSSVGLGKVFYFLDQMKVEVTEADRTIKTLQRDTRLMRDKNKDLEAKNRELDRKWKEEKSLRETAEAQVRDLMGQIKERENDSAVQKAEKVAASEAVQTQQRSMSVAAESSAAAPPPPSVLKSATSSPVSPSAPSTAQIGRATGPGAASGAVASSPKPKAKPVVMNNMPPKVDVALPEEHPSSTELSPEKGMAKTNEDSGDSNSDDVNAIAPEVDSRSLGYDQDELLLVNGLPSSPLPGVKSRHISIDSTRQGARGHSRHPSLMDFDPLRSESAARPNISDEALPVISIPNSASLETLSLCSAPPAVDLNFADSSLSVGAPLDQTALMGQNTLGLPMAMMQMQVPPTSRNEQAGPLGLQQPILSNGLYEYQQQAIMANGYSEMPQQQQIMFFPQQQGMMFQQVLGGVQQIPYSMYNGQPAGNSGQWLPQAVMSQDRYIPGTSSGSRNNAQTQQSQAGFDPFKDPQADPFDEFLNLRANK